MNLTGLPFLCDPCDLCGHSNPAVGPDSSLRDLSWPFAQFFAAIPALFAFFFGYSGFRPFLDSVALLDFAALVASFSGFEAPVAQLDRVYDFGS